MHLVKQHGLGIVFALQFPHPLNLIKSRKLSSKFVESNAETQKEKGPNNNLSRGRYCSFEFLTNFP